MEKSDEIKLIVSSVKTGDIVFRKANIFIDKLIVFFLNIRCILYGEPKIEYAHCGRIVVLEGLPFICEAIESGVEMMLFSEWLKKDSNFKGVLITRRKEPRSESLYKSIGLQFVGNTPYDYAGTFIFSALKIFFNKWFGPKGKLSAKSQFCTEYCARWDEDIFPESFDKSTRDLYFSNYYGVIYKQV